MSDDAENADQGLLDTHTRLAPAAIGLDVPSSADLAASVAALGAAAEHDSADQLDLLSGQHDHPPLDALEVAAETSATQRRARGRPRGSANKRNTMVFELLEAKGHRDPAETLSLLQTVDTIALAKALGEPLRDTKGRLVRTPVRDSAGELMRDDEGELILEVVYAMADPVKVAQLQRQAAADLMPYKYAKKPQAIELPPQVQRPVMIIGEMNVQQNNQTFLSAGGEYEGNQGLSAVRTVRLPDDESHDNGQVVEYADENGDIPTD